MKYWYRTRKKARSTSTGIPDRVEPDTELSRTKPLTPPESHIISLVEPERGRFRIRMIWEMPTPPPLVPISWSTAELDSPITDRKAMPKREDNPEPEKSGL